MATIRSSNGTVLTSLVEGQVDQSTSLTLVPEGVFEGVADAFANNLIQLLDNGSSVEPPVNPIRGQTWFDETRDAMMVWTNDEWQPLSADPFDDPEFALAVQQVLTASTEIEANRQTIANTVSDFERLNASLTDAEADVIVRRDAATVLMDDASILAEQVNAGLAGAIESVQEAQEAAATVIDFATNSAIYLDQIQDVRDEIDLARAGALANAALAEQASANAVGFAGSAQANAATASTAAQFASANAAAALSSATQSAGFAGQSLANAVIARDQAIIATNNAAIAVSNAVQTSTFRGQAQANAQVAATQATYATDNATTANQQATLSVGHAGNAATQAGIATTQAGYASANAAAASVSSGLTAGHAANANTARGHAVTNAALTAQQLVYATANASLAQSNAVLSANYSGQAGANAASAAAQATIATTQAAYASANASLASTAQTLASGFATTALNLTKNYGFEGGTAGWLVAGGLAVSVAPSLAGKTNVLTWTAGQERDVFGAPFAFETSRKYRVRAWVYTGAGTGTAQMYIGFRAKDAAGTSLTHTPGSYAYVAATGVFQAANAGWVEYVSPVIVAQSSGIFGYPPGTAQIEPMALLNYNSTNNIAVALDGIWIEDVTSEVAAQSNATIAAQQATYATANAAAASASSVLAASVGNNSIIPNPRFTSYTNPGVSYPEDWTLWSGNLSRFSRVAGETGGWACKMEGVATDNTGLYQVTPIGSLSAGQWMVIEASVRLDQGAFESSGVLFYHANAATSVLGTTSINFATDKDNTGVVVGAGVVGRTYRFSKLVQVVSDLNVSRAILYAMVKWSGFGSIANRTDVTFFNASLRPATAMEISTQTALQPGSATVTAIQTALTTLDGETRARWAIGAAVPGAAAFIEARAETVAGQAPTSNVAIGATQFAVYNPSGGDWKKALEVVGGNVLLSGGLQAGTFIRLGNGQGWPVALRSVDFTATDGEVISFGTDLGSLPALTFANNNLAPLAAGETYNVFAENLTATGFTLRAKISVPAATANQSIGGTSSLVTISGYNGRKKIRGALPDTADGTYRIVADGSQSATIYGSGTGYGIADNEAYVDTYLSIYALKAGSWVLVATTQANSVFDPDDYPSGPNEAYAFWTIDEVVTVGTGATEIAVVVSGSSTGYGGIVNSLSQVQWQSAGSSSGVRTATPNGEKTRITVRPQ